MTPVGMTEIAERANVKPDTVKKWREREIGFPKHRWTVGGHPAWAWEEVGRWLRATRRAPNFFRFRATASDGSVILEESLDADDNWEPTVKFVDIGPEGWRAFPCRALEELAKDPQLVADRHLRSWLAAQQKWVAEHPDEPMPLHLSGDTGRES